MLHQLRPAPIDLVCRTIAPLATAPEGPVRVVMFSVCHRRRHPVIASRRVVMPSPLQISIGGIGLSRSLTIAT